MAYLEGDGAKKSEGSGSTGEKHAWKNGEKSKSNWLSLSKWLVCVLVWMTLVWHIPEEPTSDYIVGGLTTQPTHVGVHGIH